MSFVNQIAFCQVGCPLGALTCANTISPKIATLEVYLRPGVTTWEKNEKEKNTGVGPNKNPSKARQGAPAPGLPAVRAADLPSRPWVRGSW